MTLTFESPLGRPYLNILLYGGSGDGKTTAALGAPGPVLLLNAEGPGGPAYARQIYGDEQIHEVKVLSGQTLDDALVHIRKGCVEKTVVLDSIGEIYKVLVDEEAGRKIGQIRGSKAEIQHYGNAGTWIERFARDVRDLPINMVLICHEMSVVGSEGGMERMPFTGSATNTSLGAKLMGMVDVVGACMPIVDKKGNTHRAAQVVSGDGRRGKNREGLLGALAELDVNAWITKYTTTKETA